MQSTYDAAVDKMRDELAQKADHPGVATIGEYLTYRLQREPGLAGQILQEDKTIEGAFTAIRDYARKNQKNGWCYVPPDKALALACEYFGIPADGAKADAQTLAPAAPADDGLDLDRLLGGA